MLYAYKKITLTQYFILTVEIWFYAIYQPNLNQRTLMKMTDKQIRILSIVATLAAVGMYVSYIPQIQNNLNGRPGSWLQPLAAAVNCTLWVTYALFKKNRDYPVALANAPGIFLGLITFLTSF